MNTIRYRLALMLADMAARIYPLSGRMAEHAHHVGRRWLVFRIES